jgi:hypothetical protein
MLLLHFSVAHGDSPQQTATRGNRATLIYFQTPDIPFFAFKKTIKKNYLSFNENFYKLILFPFPVRDSESVKRVAAVAVGLK